MEKEKNQIDTNETKENSSEAAIENLDLGIEGLSEAVSEMADEQEKKVSLSIKWEEEGEEELRNSIFRHSPETVKKGEPYDLLVLFCAFFAFACSFVMVVSGINHGFTPSMIVLLICYVLIIICCLCKPLHYGLSKLIWKTGFKDRFPVNHACGDSIRLSDTALEYTDVSGSNISVPYDEMTGIYETENYIVFHENDHQIFAANKRQINNDELKKKVYDLVSEHDNTGYELKSAEEIEREIITSGRESGDSSADYEKVMEITKSKKKKKKEELKDELVIPKFEKPTAPKDDI